MLRRSAADQTGPKDKPETGESSEEDEGRFPAKVLGQDPGHTHPHQDAKLVGSRHDGIEPRPLGQWEPDCHHPDHGRIHRAVDQALHEAAKDDELDAKLVGQGNQEGKESTDQDPATHHPLATVLLSHDPAHDLGQDEAVEERAKDQRLLFDVPVKATHAFCLFLHTEVQ